MLDPWAEAGGQGWLAGPAGAEEIAELVSRCISRTGASGMGIVIDAGVRPREAGDRLARGTAPLRSDEPQPSRRDRGVTP